MQPAKEPNNRTNSSLQDRVDNATSRCTLYSLMIGTVGTVGVGVVSFFGPAVLKVFKAIPTPAKLFLGASTALAVAIFCMYRCYSNAKTKMNENNLIVSDEIWNLQTNNLASSSGPVQQIR